MHFKRCDIRNPPSSFGEYVIHERITDALLQQALPRLQTNGVTNLGVVWPVPNHDSRTERHHADHCRKVHFML
ncbi:MAG: hypothetical protein KC593_02535 [Myxococcales bacterium]|nr:hypothetical protein [Myxococcales bacterium]